MSNNDYSLSFISQENFERHIKETINTYGNNLNAINLDSFNKNIIDPIKLLFDKEVFQQSFEETISFELQRQRDKSNTNAIGYFHQNMFKHIGGCSVPNQVWDVIFEGKYNIPNQGRNTITGKEYKKIYVEMKNKHNTMNSSSAQKTYMKMRDKINDDDDCVCMLVEAIAQASRDETWGITLDGKKTENKRIRRVSIDRFYKITTGIDDAFYQICLQLPKTIKKLISEKAIKTIGKDTVIGELRKKHPDTLTALYLLAFKTYEGFDGITSYTNYE